MMIIEMRHAAKDRAFDLLDEMKELGRKKKLVLCELESALYNCFESDEDEEYEDPEEYSPEDEGEDMEYRRRRSYRYRRGMRDTMDGMDEPTWSGNRRSSMRMRRRDRMGRFA